MKLRLAQRILLSFYKTKIRTLAVISPKKAAQFVFQVFCTPRTGKAPKKSPAIFHKATKIKIELNGLLLQSYHWEPEHANGKKVLILHGFGSYAYKFEKYVQAFLKIGYSVSTFDAPAHGASQGKQINAYLYKQCIDQIEKSFGPYYALMGHSIGATAAALAMEGFDKQVSRKLVLIAPATETLTSIKQYFKLLAVEPKVQAAFWKYLSEITHYPIEYFSVSRSIRQIQSPVLWVHDTKDRITPYSDVEPVLKLGLPNVTFVITEGLGHNKIYKDQEICYQIVHFLNQP